MGIMANMNRHRCLGMSLRKQGGFGLKEEMALGWRNFGFGSMSDGSGSWVWRLRFRIEQLCVQGKSDFGSRLTSGS